MDTNEITTETTDIVTTAPATVIPLHDMVQDAEMALEAVKTAQLAYEARLQTIATTHGNTYEHNGEWYQIRSRESTVEGRKITYLCGLKAEPKTWLKGPKAKAKAAEAAVVTSSVETQTVDGVTTTVID